MLPVMNDGVRPAIRVILAGQPPSSALHLLPRRTRPAVLAVASSEAGVTVETATAYGARAWRVEARTAEGRPVVWYVRGTRRAGRVAREAIDALVDGRPLDSVLPAVRGDGAASR